MAEGWLPRVACHGGKGQAVFTYDTQWQVDDQGGYTMYWQKQPGTLADAIDVTWNDGDGHTYTASGSLAQDRAITLLPTTVTLTPGQPAQATLPSLSLG